MIPTSLSGGRHAVPQNSYYTQGMYVNGGSQALSNGIASIITDNGGKLKTKADVTDILLEGNKAIGVRYFDKKSKEEVVVYADKIIANCDPATVYHKLLPQDRDYSKDLNLTKDLEITTSLISIYMIFDKKPNDLYPDMDYSTFIVSPENFNRDFKDSDCFNTSYEDIDFVFVNYSRVDSGLSDREDRHLGVIATLGRYEDWENLDKEEYRVKKDRVQTILENRLERAFPGIMKHCIHSELATPKTIKRYIRTRKGTPYGYDQNKEFFFRREQWISHSVKTFILLQHFVPLVVALQEQFYRDIAQVERYLILMHCLEKFALSIFFGTRVSLGIMALYGFS